ncbi:DnaJ domain-containing protein [Legionella waltersii]|uniref:Chaperone protein DnaJ n=1 Tax=Legionella waltersii TaxID=66969 RepID=A0A0W1ALF7_9GAMM|nr:DnaJ domain-containing protein [Legionella waltersii]KTD82175.1 Chaperone protein DnaJ [Legionella waltersii]SNV10500.1 Ribosome-associated chaperone zuotin [Legionella waltersii]
MPTLILPGRFQAPPFNGDYYKILGLNTHSPTIEQITTAYHTTAIMYHPDKISTSTVKPPLSLEEATECFKAIGAIKSILLSQCAEVIYSSVPTFGKNSSVQEEIRSADDLSPGEQLKAVMLAYVRSARFCEYAPGTGPGVRGYWDYIVGGKNGIEQGTSNFSGKYAIASPNYQVELDAAWDQPLIVLNKGTKPFTKMMDPHGISEVLGMLADSIPRELRDHCAKIYGSHVREIPVLAEKEIPVAITYKPYVILDPKGNNYADGIRQNKDNSYTIFGRNSTGQSREITLFQDGQVLGTNRNSNLGIVGNQFFENREELFRHFGLDISQAIPSLSVTKALSY